MVQEASVLIKLIHFGTKLNEDVDLTRLGKPEVKERLKFVERLKFKERLKFVELLRT